MSTAPAVSAPGSLQPSGLPSRSVTRRYGTPGVVRSAICSAVESTATIGDVLRSRPAEEKKDRRRMPRSVPRKSSTKASAGSDNSSAGGANWASLPPVRRTATIVPSLIASSMSWVTKTMVLPNSSWRRRSSSWRPLRTTGSTAENGSSISSTGGSAARARATPTRCCWPPESWYGYRLARAASRPTRPMSSVARALAFSLPQPSMRGTVAMLSTIVRCWKSPAFWMT